MKISTNRLQIIFLSTAFVLTLARLLLRMAQKAMKK